MRRYRNQSKIALLTQFMQKFELILVLNLPNSEQYGSVLNIKPPLYAGRRPYDSVFKTEAIIRNT